MKAVRWHDIAELIGIGAIVASLLFVGLQLRQAQRIALSERNASELANAIQESSALMAYADTWVRGNAGEALTPVEQVVFRRLVRNVNDLAYFNVQQQRLLGRDDVAELDIAAYAGFLHENPGARRGWRTREENLQRYRRAANPDERITPGWIEAVEAYLAALERDGEAGTQSSGP